jgi:hypothetical protein
MNETVELWKNESAKTQTQTKSTSIELVCCEKCEFQVHQRNRKVQNKNNKATQDTRLKWFGTICLRPPEMI